jgi:CheY-like chemotaxis protein
VLFAARRAAGAVRFEVWDSGRGIPPEAIDAVFEEFVQLDNPERDRAKGLGLGLAVCRRLSELTGHDLTVASRVGRGSVFRLRVAATTAAPAAPAATEGAAPLAGALVLVIDDDAEVRAATRALLEAAGLWVMAAPGGAAARATIESAARYPDAIVCDYRLAGAEDGIALARALRQAIPQPVGIAIVTGDAAPPAPPDMQVLAKPVAPEVLLAALARAVNPVRPN